MCWSGCLSLRARGRVRVRVYACVRGPLGIDLPRCSKRGAWLPLVVKACAPVCVRASVCASVCVCVLFLEDGLPSGGPCPRRISTPGGVAPGDAVYLMKLCPL